jgi:HD-like signal output (HDOD) protein
MPAASPAHPTSRPTADYTLKDWVSADDLAAPARAHLLKRIETLPRLPSAVQQLLSQEFIDKASSAELSKVVMSEPAVTAKVLATVNSPLYKLRNPVESIGQAITFLGVNQVRAICIQSFLTKAFSSSDERVGLALDAVWHTNSAATLLLPKLVQAFRPTEPVALTSQIILSFVGQLGVAALMPPPSLGVWSRLDRMLRYRMEEQFLGLNATEVGALVLRGWGIPEPMVTAVGAIDRVMVIPANGLDPAGAAHSAVGFLCAWMAEQLARGLGSSADSPWSPLDTDCAELQTWFSYLSLPGMREGADKTADENMQAVYQQIRAELAG